MLLGFVHLSTKCFQKLNITKVSSTNLYIQAIRVQKYSRLASRRPAKIVNEDELFEVEEAAYPAERDNYQQKLKNLKKFGVDTSAESDFTELDNHENDSSENVKPKKHSFRKHTSNKRKKETKPNVETEEKNIFTKLFENEKFLSSQMVEIKSRKKRKKMDKIVLEGTRLITDAIEAGQLPEMIIFSNFADVKKIPVSEKDIKMYKVPYRTIQLWSSLTTPPGIMGVFKTPDVETIEPLDSLPITIICDNIRDPGNMGSILRAAAGVGCDKVILTKGCVDLWESKVLRTAAGAHFRLPIYNSKEWDEIKLLISADAQIVVADNNVNDEQSSFNEDESLVNEDESLVNEDESLVNENDFEEIKQNGEKVEQNNKSGTKSKKMENFDFINEIPSVPYFSIDYTEGETVIIIGGETEGLSEESFRLVNDTQGIRVNVPLNNRVESLNSGMALGVIAFEIKRQFLVAAQKAE